MTSDKLPALWDFHHYLPIPDELIRGGFYVTSAGRGVIHPGEAYPKDRHPRLYNFTWAEGRTFPDFALIFITSGQGWFESRPSGLVNVKAGDAFFLFPGVWHRYRPAPRTGWMEKWVQFNGSHPQQMLDQGIISPPWPIHRPADPGPLECALNCLHEQIHRDPASNSLLLSLQAFAALAHVLGAAPIDRSSTAVAAPQRADPVIIAAVDYIWTRSYDVLSVAEVARATGVTRRTLERRFSANLGHSVLEEIVRCRYSRAERLLRATDLPIKSVTQLSGFGSLENLRHVFLERVGLSPGAYREHYRARIAEWLVHDHKSVPVPFT